MGEMQVLNYLLLSSVAFMQHLVSRETFGEGGPVDRHA